MSYVSRQQAPLWWWAIAAGIGLTVLVAVWAYLGIWWALGLTVAVMALCGAFIGEQSLVVIADDAGLRAGHASIGWEWVAGAAPLDPDATRRRLHNADHHNDFLAVRPYTTSSVVVQIADPADPHPAWVVGCPDPLRLSACVHEHLNRSGIGTQTDVETGEKGGEDD